ncbi:TPA: transposase [Neisseria meningitidis]
MKISASDIAKLGIPSLPTDRQGIEYHAKKNNWQHCFEQKGRGRPKKLYEIASLPAEIRAAIMKRQSDELAEKMPKMLPKVRPGTAMSAQALAEAAKLLNEKQRSVADARCAVVAAVLGIKYEYDCSAKAAVAQFLGLLAEGKLDAVTLGNLEKANDRSRTAKVGERTLDGWISAYLKAENATERLVALAPKTTKAVKPIESYGWLPMFMQFHNIPSAPKLAHSYRWFVQWAEAENMPVNDVPNLSMVRRVWEKLPLIMQERGRKTGAAYKSLLPYVKRDWGALKPNDVWIGDGHSFKAKVAHPVHGRPFKPEVTVIIDGCTRFVVGFSVSLAESCVAVSDAMRIGVKHFGLPIIYYSDNGGGQTGKTIDHEITGITSRPGIRHETGIAGNPQGRGIIERWWKDNLIEMARQYETFAGAGMDSSTKNLMYRKMESAFNALEKGKDLTEEQQKYLKKLPSWSRFIADVVKCIDEYNNRPHGELPRHPDGGHYTPKAYREMRLEQDGIAPDMLSAQELATMFMPQELATMFMPQEVRKVQRGWLDLFNNSYFSTELAEYHKDEVRVSYDLSDASAVNVFDMDGKFITKAQANGNTREAFPTARIDQLAEKRRKGKIKRAENAIKLANAEVNPALEQAAVWDELGHLGGNDIEAEYAVLPKTGTDDFVLFEADR